MTAPDAAADGPAAGPLYSVCIPVYRSARILPDLVARLDAFFDGTGWRHEYVFVNDASPDDSWEVLVRLKGSRTDIVVVDLMRNYGQHSALFCALRTCRGDFAITMDDDLQNPPEEIRALVDRMGSGDFDAVFGKFRVKRHGLVRRLGSGFVNWLNRKLFRKPEDLVLSNFRILRRPLIDGICEFETSFPYIPGLVLMTGRRFANVDVEHHPRVEGRSNYGVMAIARLVWRILINYSPAPLRALYGAGMLFAFGSFAFGLYHLVRSLLVDSRTAGWPTLVVLLSFYQGIVLLLLAAMSEYLVRIAGDVAGRRAYRVRETR